MIDQRPPFVISLIGRPNVGKSALFNRLIRKQRKAITFNSPGVTRDRQYGLIPDIGARAILTDTGGLYPEGAGLFPLVAQQIYQAIDDSDLILLVFDVREGRHPLDEQIFDILRRRNKEFWVLANKSDSHRQVGMEWEFFALGVKGEHLFRVSAAHGLGIERLRDCLRERAHQSSASVEAVEVKGEEEDVSARLAIVGMPNVGKSTLLNGLLGRGRAITSDIPGTTTDPIRDTLTIDKWCLTIIDTAGIRRKGRIEEKSLEAQAVAYSLQSIREADIVLYLVDALKGVVHQDLRLIDIALEKGKSVIVCLNKIDRRSDLQKASQWQEWVKDVIFRASWAQYCPILPLSAKEQQGVKELEREIVKTVSIRQKNIPTGELNRVIHSLVEKKTVVPQGGKVPLKIKYASQIKTAPPTFLLFSNRVKGIPTHYRRYLQRHIRAHFGLDNTPVRLIFALKSFSE